MKRGLVRRLGNSSHVVISIRASIYQNIECLFRGGGNRTDAKLIGPKGVRAQDFTIIYDDEERIDIVLPNIGRGLSFSDNIGRLERLGISGVVWKLPKDSIIPKGLIINYKTKDHPLINVEHKMSIVELEVKLKIIADQMVASDARIK